MNRLIPPTLTMALLFAGFSFFQSCVSDNIEDTVTSNTCDETISFSGDVQPIINANCAVATCHNGSLGTDLDWRNAATLKLNASDVKFRISLPQSDARHMPKNGSLPQEQVDILKCWVDQGANINN